MKKILFSLLMLCCMTAAWAQPWPPGVYEVGTLERFKEVISHRMSSDGKCIADIKLTADIYLNDCPELCRTFTGTLDGNGFTIYAGDENAHHDGRGLAHGKYLFTYSEGATFKNLTFKDFRADTDEHSNWSFLTSQATDGCVFENITFDHVSIWAKVDNVGAVAGIADNCTFTNITVKNGDFTVDSYYVGAVVGKATNCTFTNIEVDTCESTSTHYSLAGGVVGGSNDCTFTDVQVKNSFVKTFKEFSGGVSGNSSNSLYTNCVIDDQSCIYAEGSIDAEAGGISGGSEQDEFRNCINSALVAANKTKYAGGIVGKAKENTTIESCLNTGMVVNTTRDNLDGENGYYSKYKKQELTCVTKYYKGKEYVVRVTELGSTMVCYFGGIVGDAEYSSISKCTNFGSLNAGNGGIVGYAYCSNINDCLSDFSSPSGVYGIVRDGNAESSINNCLDLSGKESYGIRSFDNVTNLYTSSSANMTAADLTSGKSCSILGANWEQNVGTDPTPTPGDKGIFHLRNVSNQYGTACFPFSVKSDDEISYYTFNEASVGGDIKLMFKYAKDMIPAGTPVLFRAADAVEATEPVEVCFSHYGDGFTKYPNSPTLPLWGMEGTFEQRVFEGEAAKEIYYVSGGEIRNAKKTTIAPYRAWIYGPSIETLTATGAKSISFVVEDEDGTVTALRYDNENDTLRYDNENGKLFNVMGVEVGDGYRGIVIKNGKKMIIKQKPR